MCQPGRPLPHGRRPRRLAGLGRLPQREVGGRALALVDVDAGAGAQIVGGLAAELAVRREAGHRVVDVAKHFVGLAVGDQLRRHVDDLGDVGRDPRLDIRGQDAEQPHLAVVLVGEPARARERILAGLGGGLDDLVVDVGDVADELHLVAEQHQRAPDHVEARRRVRMPDVGGRVGRGPAQVHADLAGLDRRERDLLAAERIVDAELGHDDAVVSPNGGVPRFANGGASRAPRRARGPAPAGAFPRAARALLARAPSARRPTPGVTGCRRSAADRASPRARGPT